MRQNILQFNNKVNCLKGQQSTGNVSFIFHPTLLILHYNVYRKLFQIGAYKTKQRPLLTESLPTDMSDGLQDIFNVLVNSY